MATFIQRNGHWRAQVRRKGHKPISRSFRLKSAAEAWARQVEDAIEAGKYEDLRLNEVTLGDLIVRFLEAVGDVSATKRGNLTRWKETSGHIALGRFTAQDVIAHCKARTCGPATLNVEVGFLAEVWAAAGPELGIAVKGDPIAEARPTLRKRRLIAKPKERDRRPTAAELEELHKFFRYNINPRTIPMNDVIELAVETAMRLGEIVRLRWDDLRDDERPTIAIRDRKHPTEKESNTQRVPLLGTSLEVIKRQPQDGPLIFPYKADSISASFTRACQRLKIEDLHFHDLRHEGTSRLFEAGYQIHQVALVTGHRDWKSLKRYTQLKPEDLHR